MKITLALALSFWSFLAASGLRAATYYVATTGSDSAPGSAEQPFLTVQKAVNMAQPGDAVHVGAGTYLQDVMTYRSGTSNAPIVLDGQGLATVRSFLLRHQYIALYNFTIAGRTNYYQSLLYMSRGAHHCVISNNVVDGAFNDKVYPVSWMTPSTLPFGEDAASDTLFVSNTITRGIACTMMSIMGDRNIIRGNRLIDGNMVDWFRLWGRSNVITGNICSNNIESTAGNHPDFIQTFGNNGYGSRWQTIENNLVVTSTNMQINMLTSDGMTNDIRDWTFRNNVYVDVGYAGPVVIPNTTYYNNLFLRCNNVGGGHVLVFNHLTFNGVYYQADGARVFNNIFLDCGDSRTNVGWYMIETNLVDVAADCNYVAKSNYGAVKVDLLHRAIGDPGGWDYMCMAWYEPHGINGGDPMFVSERQHDFRLKEGSPLIGAAYPLNQLFTADMRGTTRGAQWDIGALEFQPGETVSRPLPPSNLTGRPVSP